METKAYAKARLMEALLEGSFKELHYTVDTGADIVLRPDNVTVTYCKRTHTFSKAEGVSNRDWVHNHLPLTTERVTVVL